MPVSAVSARSALATKLSGYGNVPGQKAGTPKPIGSGFGGKLSNSLSNSLSSTPTFTAQVPGSAAYGAAQAGAAPTIGAGGSGAGATGDPRDPSYWTDVAKINQTFNTNNQSYDLQQTQAQTSRDNALTQLDKQQPIDVTKQRAGFNSSGLLYSTALSNAKGDLDSQYDTNRTNTKTGFTNLVDQLNILRNTNQATYGTGPGGALTGTAYLDALNAGIGRQTTTDTSSAAAGTLAPMASQPGQVVNGQFQSSILSPHTTNLINQWIQQANKKKK